MTGIVKSGREFLKLRNEFKKQVEDGRNEYDAIGFSWWEENGLKPPENPWFDINPNEYADRCVEKWYKDAFEGAAMVDEFRQKYYKPKRDEFKHEGWHFLTIRPDGVPFNDFKNFVETLFKKKCWEQWEYTWEQKGETIETMGHGFHIHAFVKVSSPTKGKGHYAQEVMKLIKKMQLEIGGGAVQMSDRIKSQDEMDRRRPYVNTEVFLKSEEYKKPAWILDAPWRAKMSLPSTVKSGVEGKQLDISVMTSKFQPQE